MIFRSRTGIPRFLGLSFIQPDLYEALYMPPTLRDPSSVIRGVLHGKPIKDPHLDEVHERHP
jgi:hypothetical protein